MINNPLQQNVDIVENYTVITDDNFTSKILDNLLKEEALAFDIETTGLNSNEDSIILIQIGTSEFQYVFNLNEFRQVEKLFPIFKSEDITKIGHNLKFDFSFLLNYNIHPTQIKNIWDTYTYEKIITAGIRLPSEANFRLKKGMAKKYLNRFFTEEPRKAFTTQHKINSTMYEYAARDIILTYLIWVGQTRGVVSGYGNQKLKIWGYNDIIKSIPSLQNIVDLEMKIVPCIAQVEKNGIKFNERVWIDEIKKVEIELLKIEQEIKEAFAELKVIAKLPYKTGRSKKTDDSSPFLFEEVKNSILQYVIYEQKKDGGYKPIPFLVNSPKLITLALNKMGYDIISSSDEVLETIDHPIVDKIQQFRTLSKLVTAYGTNWFKYLDRKTERIYAEFDPYLATGRIQAKNPNLAQVPKPTESLNLRKAFDAPKGYKIITADYSGCELRIIAELSGDPEFRKIFTQGLDPHGYVATLVFNKPVSKTENSHLRTVVKPVIFGLAYGAGINKLAAQAKIPYTEMRDIVNSFYSKFPKIKQFFEDSKLRVLETGYALTIGGRPRFFEIPTPQAHHYWEIWTGEEYKKQVSHIQRQAGNHPIQGTNADALKMAIYYLSVLILKEKYDAKIVNLVHDEIVVQVAEDQAEVFKERMATCLKWCLSQYVKSIPVEIDIQIADTWVK